MLKDCVENSKFGSKLFRKYLQRDQWQVKRQLTTSKCLSCEKQFFERVCFLFVMKVDSLIPPSAAIFMGPINLQEYKPESAFSSCGDIIFIVKNRKIIIYSMTIRFLRIQIKCKIWQLVLKIRSHFNLWPPFWFHERSEIIEAFWILAWFSRLALFWCKCGLTSLRMGHFEFFLFFTKGKIITIQKEKNDTLFCIWELFSFLATIIS